MLRFILHFRSGLVVLLCVLSLCALPACDASFSDLRPASDGGLNMDSDTEDQGTDAVLPDASISDSSMSDSSTDDSAVPDAPVANGQEIAAGSFAGRSGYDAEGTATLVSLGGDNYQIRLDNFASAAVPGPALVVSPRAAIGNALVPEDIVITRLTGNQFREDGSYDFTASNVGPGTYVYIYCEPFGVETAATQLEAL